jgi:hypothetical protein
MASSNTQSGSMEVDPSRAYVYSTDTANSIRLHNYSFNNEQEDSKSDLSYIARIPVVRVWDGTTVNPDNLLLYNGGNNMLLSDAETYDSILNMNIERGIVTKKQSIHKSFGGRTPEDVIFKVKKFDYNTHSDEAQFDNYAIGINSNHLMRFDLDTGNIAHKKAYEKNPHFTAVATDIYGNVVVGGEDGAIRIFPDVGKRAAKCWVGLGDSINDLKISNKGDVIATTKDYLIYLPDFINKTNIEYHLGKLGQEVSVYLKLIGKPIRNAQFSPDDKTVIFAIDQYLFHWSIRHLVNDIREFSIYEADSPILCHKYTDSQFVLSSDKPFRFN